jgi:hypothetical protein
VRAIREGEHADFVHVIPETFNVLDVIEAIADDAFVDTREG